MKPIFFAYLSLMLVTPLLEGSQTWQVGPTRIYKNPSEVTSLVGNGDIVKIDAGTYKDVCNWYDDQLTLKGVGGMVHLDADGIPVSQGKAIWVIKGNGTRVENIEFSGASCVDRNGAGIRQEGNGLVVRNCHFHDNEDGILGSGDGTDDILIEHSEFGYNGYGDGYSHNLYIGHAGTLTIRYCYFHHAIVGHEVKSRAAENYILYNRISNEDGNASRCIDLPNAGSAWIIGNLIHQGNNAENGAVFGFGLEGGSGTGRVFNNTFVNERGNVYFVQVASGCDAVLGNNIFYGGSNVFLVSGNGTYSGSHNYIPPGASGAGNLSNSIVGGAVDFADLGSYDYHLTAGSVCIDQGLPLGPGVTPVKEYLHPADYSGRPMDEKIDIGAYEFSPGGLRPLPIDGMIPEG